MGLERAGFDVTGVDIRPQPRHRGGAFVEADALTFPLEGYDFIWASPPCQRYSSISRVNPGREYPDLIPATRARLVETGTAYCIENVEGAPLGASGFLILLCGTMFGLQTPDGRAEIRRHRLFETSFSIPLRPPCQHGGEVIGVVGDHPHSARVRHEARRRRSLSVTGNAREISPSNWGRRRSLSVTGNTPQTSVVRNAVRETFSIAEARAAMGIDWMVGKELSQAIPPAYAEWIGRQALAYLASLHPEVETGG